MTRWGGQVFCSDMFRPSMSRVFLNFATLSNLRKPLFGSWHAEHVKAATGRYKDMSFSWGKTKEAATMLENCHFFETMCPTAFLAPTLIAKTCFICTQPKHAFFLAQLALQGHRANGKKPLPGRVPGPKKGTKMVPKSGSFQKKFFCLVAKKKSQKLDRALP